MSKCSLYTSLQLLTNGASGNRSTNCEGTVSGQIDAYTTTYSMDKDSDVVWGRPKAFKCCYDDTRNCAPNIKAKRADNSLVAKDTTTTTTTDLQPRQSLNGALKLCTESGLSGICHTYYYNTPT